MKPGFVLGCVSCLALLAGGCGSGRSSKTTFRAQANRICAETHRQTRSVDFSTRSGFGKGLAGMRAGAGRLARLHPPSQGETAYRDLVARLRDIDARLDLNEAKLLRLQHRLKGSVGRSATRAVKRFGTLVAPIERDGLRAAADARTLRLGVCATDLLGGAPLAQAGSPT